MEIKVYEKGQRDQAFYAYVGPYALSREVTKEMHDPQYGQIYDEPYAVWFLATENGKLLGFCALYDKPKEVFFDNCYVVKDHRGQGIGKALFAARLEYSGRIAAGRKIKGVTMNPVQYEIYLKYGFKLASKRGKYYWMEMEVAK